MRRFSKLLAVLLTVCVIFGVALSLVISAEDEPLTAQLIYATGNGTGDNTTATDSLHGVSNSTYALGVTRTSTSRYLAVRPNIAAKGPTIGVTGVAGSYTDTGLTINAFYDQSQKKFLAGTKNTTDSKTGVTTPGRADFGINTDNFIEYMTYDFDFGVDAYRYVYVDADGKTVKTIDETAVEGMTEVDSLESISATAYYRELAMPEGYWGRFETYTNGTSEKGLAAFYIRQDDNGDWYACQNTTVKGSTWKYKLSNDVGKYDHFTWVWHLVDNDTNPDDDSEESETKSTDPITLHIFLYINGEYVGKQATVSGITKMSIKRYYYAFRKADTVQSATMNGTDSKGNAVYTYDSFSWRNDYAIGYKNIAMNYYSAQDLESTNLDEFMEGENYNTNFYGVNNIVANKGYITPNYDTVYLTLGEQTFYLPQLGAVYAADAIKNGDTLILSGKGASLENFDPGEDVTYFRVKCLDGATFTTASRYGKYATGDSTVDFFHAFDESLVTGEGRLNVTGDKDNLAEDFVSASINNTTENDGDQTLGVLQTASTGYYRVYSNGGKTKFGSSALKAWIATKNSSIATTSGQSNLYDSSYTVIDFEFGTDRYAFKYTADVERQLVITGAGAAESTESLKGATFYEYVTSIEEFKALLKDPSPLAGTKVTKNQKGSSYTYTLTDTLSNVVIDENSLQLALGNGGANSIGFASAFLYGATVDGTKTRNNLVNYNAFVVKDPDTGLWYLSDKNAAYSASNNNILLSNELGVTDHITIVFDNGIQNEGYLTYTIYVNGEYLSSAALTSSTLAYNNYKYVTTRGIGFYIDGSNKLKKNFSLTLSDFAMNFYRSDVVYDNETTVDAYVGVESYNPYTSGDAVYGVDDLIADLKAGNKYPCTKAQDLYYNENLIDPKGWVTVDGGETVMYSSAEISEALAGVTDGTTIITGRSLTFAALPEGVSTLKFVTARDAKITVCGNLLKTHILKAGENGSYTIRALLNEEKLNVIFKDLSGNVYHSVYLAPTELLALPEFSFYYFDPAEGLVREFDNWVIESTGATAEGYFYREYFTPDEALVVTPNIKDTVLKTFALYKVDEAGNKVLYGTLDNYSAFTKAKIDAALALIEEGDKAVLTLLYDGAVDLGVATKISVTKDLSLDLNGRTLIHSYTASGASYGMNLFVLGDGVTFNLYSSKEGGKIYQAYYPGTNYLSGGGTWGSGLFGDGDSKSLTLNVGAFDHNGEVCDDYSGNLGIYGGTIVFFDSYNTPYHTEKLDFNVNIRGTEVYQATRSGYAAVTARANGVNITLKDSQFYSNSNGSYYSAVYDYYESKNPTKYSTASHTTIDNCTFIGTNGYADYNAGTLRSHFIIGANSTLTMTNSTVYGKIGANEASLTLGEGNFIVGSGIDLTRYPGMLGENISFGTVNAYAGTSFTHPQLYMFNNVGGYDTIIHDGKNYVLNPVAYDVDQWVTSSVAYKGVIYTYASDAEAPVYSTAKVERYYGSKLKDTLNWVVGTEFGQIEVKTNHIYHYAGNYVWGYENGNSAMGEVISGDTVLKLIDFDVFATGFSEMQANLTLKTDMKFNLYIPARPGVTINSVSVGTLLPYTFTYGSVEYYVVVIDLTAGNFDAIELTVGYSVFNNAYGDYTAEFEDVITIDYVASYATPAYAAENCNSTVAQLLKEIIDYNVAVAKYLDPTFDESAVASLKAFYNAHNITDKRVCSCTDVAHPEATDTDLSGVANYITNATFYLDSEMGTMGLILYVKGDYKGSGITVTYTDVDGKTVSATAEFIPETGFIVVSNIKAAYIANVMTIKVGEAVGTYSLATYVAGCTDANALAVANALLEYSAAANAYKASVN